MMFIPDLPMSARTLSKPHIKLNTNGRWVCMDWIRTGQGLTPEQAYRNWRTLRDGGIAARLKPYEGSIAERYTRGLT